MSSFAPTSSSAVSVSSAAVTVPVSVNDSVRGPFQVVSPCPDGCCVTPDKFTTEVELRAYLEQEMKQIQEDYENGSIKQNSDPKYAIAAPTEEEVATIVSGELSLDEAVRKIHAWNAMHPDRTVWLVQEIVQPTEANPRAAFREIGAPI